MGVPDDLKADSGLKAPVRHAVRPQLEFIKTSLKGGVSEAAIYRYLKKHGHQVGSRSGFGAALKFLLGEEQSASAVNVLASRSSLAAVPAPPDSANPASIARPDSAEAVVPLKSPAKPSFGDDRHKITWGTA